MFLNSTYLYCFFIQILMVINFMFSQKIHFCCLLTKIGINQYFSLLNLLIYVSKSLFMVLCNCLSSFTIERTKVSSAKILLIDSFHHAKHLYMLEIEEVQLGHLKLPACENPDNSLLVLPYHLAYHLPCHKSAI